MLDILINIHKQTSGNTSLSNWTTVLTRLPKNPGFAFNFSVAYRTPLRSMRRNTYLLYRKEVSKLYIPNNVTVIYYNNVLKR